MSNLVPPEKLATRYSGLWIDPRELRKDLSLDQMRAAWEPLAQTIQEMDGEQIAFNFMNRPLSISHRAAFYRFIDNPSIPHYAAWPDLKTAAGYFFHNVLFKTVIAEKAAPKRTNDNGDSIGIDYLALRDHLVIPVQTLIFNFSTQFGYDLGYGPEAVRSLSPRMIPENYRPAYKIA
jgi:hypothetical protein